MKKCFRVLVILFCIFVFVPFLIAGASAKDSAAVYYVDSVNGSDSNDGLSQGSAWASLAKVDSTSFHPGDSILFKRGCVFVGNAGLHGSGALGNPVKVDAYGQGDAPLLTTLGDGAVLSITDESNWSVRNLEITAPEGTGIFVSYNRTVVQNILLENITLHDIRNFPSNTYHSGTNAALRLMGSAAVPGAHLENITVNNCEIYDVGYGIFTGSNYPDTPAAPFNKNIIVENCSLHDMFDDAFIMADTDGIILRNSSIINTTQSVGLYNTAPVWLWGVTNGLVENCEFAGSKNTSDGMTVDFDDHTDNSLYQYDYSHDNVRFMQSCPSSTDLGHNTVRYCLSVNDNVIDSAGGFQNSPELDFTFYNNTLVNSGSYQFKNYNRAVIKNNIFYMKSFKFVMYDLSRTYNLSNNCYYNTFHPILDYKSMDANPLFIGNDLSDKNSFMLQAGSPCYKTGTQVEANMGAHDFYGNPLGSTHSIGCFDGELAVVKPPAGFFQDAINVIMRIIAFIKGCF